MRPPTPCSRSSFPMTVNIAMKEYSPSVRSASTPLLTAPETILPLFVVKGRDSRCRILSPWRQGPAGPVSHTDVPCSTSLRSTWILITDFHTANHDQTCLGCWVLCHMRLMICHWSKYLDFQIPQLRAVHLRGVFSYSSYGLHRWESA